MFQKCFVRVDDVESVPFDTSAHQAWLEARRALLPASMSGLTLTSTSQTSSESGTSCSEPAGYVQPLQGSTSDVSDTLVRGDAGSSSSDGGTPGLRVFGEQTGGQSWVEKMVGKIQVF
jgi:hypothetical protein